jgi:cytoskeleton protein RodZ
MLQALEDDNFDQLPGGIFNKGFVRAYARHIGLDEEQTVADYVEASGQNTPVDAPPAPDFERAIKHRHQTSLPRRVPWSLLAAALFAIALIAWLWNYGFNKKHRTPASLALAQAEKAPPNSGTTPDRLPTSTSSALPPAPLPTAAKLPTGGHLVAAAAVPSSPATPGEFTLVVVAREDCWLSIRADGKVVLEDILLADNQRAIHAQGEVVIKAGNTGALDFLLDGKKLPAQGDYGEVKTLIFRRDGLQQALPGRQTP